MTPQIRMLGDRLEVLDEGGVITGKHVLQLAHWEFRYQPEAKSFVASPADIHTVLDKLLAYFLRVKIPCGLAPEVVASRAKLAEVQGELKAALQRGAALKDGDIQARPGDFVEFLRTKVARKLKEHQIKSALHLLAVGNGANFSVPGSGKTTVVLTVFHWLRQAGAIDALFVVGPPACFGPWRDEYRAVLGAEPAVVFLAGGRIEERRGHYAATKGEHGDLYLTSFQTLQRDYELVQRLFEERGLRFFFVVDEAHYIKQLGGAWAGAALHVARFAGRRCVLSGTPFPRTYSDAFNLFDVLWPRCSPLPLADRTRIESYAQKRKDDEAIALLGRAVGPLFYRVRKSDLGLAPQEFHPPILVPMGQHEKRVYDTIMNRVRTLSQEDTFRDFDLLIRLRRGRMMRLRQTVSYTKLLGSAVLEYSENLLEGDLPLADIIRHYDDLEVPGKLTALVELVRGLRQAGEKVLIWSNFVEALKLIQGRLAAEGHGVRLIYGETPTEAANPQDEATREKIIAAFVDPASGLDLLVANPAACAESISLHKTCAHAVYYDLSYNCAQYLQSLDRIHRVGGSEEKIAHYHFLQYADTVDQDILANLQKKSAAMSAIIDKDYPVYSLDMFSADEELDAYERLFH
jgi:hypothetical protein